MKAAHQLRHGKVSERIYRLLVQLYPAPFREEFGDSMKQVFRSQCLDAIEQGSWRVIVFWCRTLFDFAWTCPKEHLLALPTLPRRTWENILRRPVWFHPTLIAVMAFGLSVFVTLRLPQFYASTVTLEITPPEYSNDGTTAAAFGGGYLIQTEFEKLQSKVVLYPVITNLALGIHYGELSHKADEPPYELSVNDAYQSLKSNLQITQIKNTKLVEVTVLDEDRALATKIANEIGTTYRHLRNEEATGTGWSNTRPTVNPQSQNKEPPTGPNDRADIKGAVAAIVDGGLMVKVINQAEDAIRSSQPNRPLNIFLGGTLSLLFGVLLMSGLLLLKRWHARRSVLVVS